MIDAVKHAERVIAHHHQRARLRPCRELILIVDELEFELAHGRVPERLARNGMRVVLVVEIFEIGLAGHAFNQPDHETLEARIVGSRIGESVDVVAVVSHESIELQVPGRD